MIIKNKDLLSTHPTREHALQILEAGLASIDTKTVINNFVKLKGNFLFIKEKTYDLSHYRNIYCLALGKDSFAAAQALEEMLGERLTGGVVLSLKNEKLKKLTNYQCTHPHPSHNNVIATKKAIGFLEATREDDLVLVVISGGGSAMLTAPYKITFEEKAKVAETLMNSGANIYELNTVRKHLSEIKGGRLAELVYPSTLITLIFSDVIGNDLSTIASGPTTMDHTSIKDAEKVLEKFEVYKKTGIKELELSESPKDSKFFEKVENTLLMDNTTATESMEEKARSLGYSTRIYANNLQGNAHKVGEILLSEARTDEALIAAGETTIEIGGTGMGGRNQELVLANLAKIKEDQVLLSAASDGNDHSSFAGALGDTYTLLKAKEGKINPEDYLKNNDSYHFFEKVGDGLETGLLQSNVADVMLVLTDKRKT